MTRTVAVGTALLLAFGLLAAQAAAMSRTPQKESAPPPPSGRAPAQAPVRGEDPGPGQARFTPEETYLIRDYFRTVPPPPPQGPPGGKKMKSLPPGLQKKVARGGELPPGWQKKIARGEVIDAQVYAHSHPLPPELAKRLPPGPPGTVVVTVEGKVVRLMEATLAILDVFDLL